MTSESCSEVCPGDPSYLTLPACLHQVRPRLPPPQVKLERPTCRNLSGLIALRGPKVGFSLTNRARWRSSGRSCYVKLRLQCLSHSCKRRLCSCSGSACLPHPLPHPSALQLQLAPADYGFALEQLLQHRFGDHHRQLAVRTTKHRHGFMPFSPLQQRWLAVAELHGGTFQSLESVRKGPYSYDRLD